MQVPDVEVCWHHWWGHWSVSVVYLVWCNL